jgi:hypothetical protein
MSAKGIGGEAFEVLVSTNCGASYDHIIWSETSYDRSTYGTGNQTLESETQWKRVFIDLSSFTGQENIRLAFVSRNLLETDIFLDNIEFFLSDDPAALRTTEPYAVYGTDPSTASDFYITFNLQERQTVKYSIIDMNGRQITTMQLQDVLNQTFQVEPKVSPGIYVLRLQIGTQIYATRVYLN